MLQPGRTSGLTSYQRPSMTYLLTAQVVSVQAVSQKPLDHPIEYRERKSARNCVVAEYVCEHGDLGVKRYIGPYELVGQ
jgi:hypothetical protein